jgi:AcrR family transcriptional regulator
MQVLNDGPVRGRPRNPETDHAIMSATLDALGSVGYAEMTLEGVARAAGVSRPTLYRRYPNKSALVTAACTAIAAQVVHHPRTGALRSDVEVLVRDLARAFHETRARAVVPALLGAVEGHPELAEAARVVWEPRRHVLSMVLTEAVERDELPPTTDVEGAVDLLYGPLYYRLLVTRQPLVPDEAVRLARRVLAGLAASSVDHEAATGR